MLLSSNSADLRVPWRRSVSGYVGDLHPGEQNPDLASVNFYFNALAPGTYPSGIPVRRSRGLSSPATWILREFPADQARGVLWNGLRPRTIYGLWNNIGFIDNPDGSEYTKRQNDQVRFTASGSADIGSHAVSVGVEYEQLTQRRYDLAPMGLWTRARPWPISISVSGRTLRHQHCAVLAAPCPCITSAATWVVTRPSSIAACASLGLDPDGNDLIEVDALDPSAFALDMFSPEELINNGNSSIAFVGYDYLGNRTKGRASFDDFFDERDEDGNYTRAQAPFQPIYMAGYVMDKFAFDDIIFNVGVRVDRYDANQVVLKDKYLCGRRIPPEAQCPTRRSLPSWPTVPRTSGMISWSTWTASISQP
ncbi:MAG: hypothetical protein IPO05_02570 [Flavobacteriales bacterium]|nr:hypothetical protein [Flavobacteriales bacterium]